MKQQKKYALILIAIAIALISLVGALWFSGKSSAPAPPDTSLPNDTTLRNALGCDRVTADYRETDPLCNNLALLKTLVKRGFTFGLDIPQAPRPDTSNTTDLVLVSGPTTQPVANRKTHVEAKHVVTCITTPCPEDQTIASWDVNSDANGLIRLEPNGSTAVSPSSFSVTVEGYRTTSVPAYPKDKFQYLVVLTEQ